MCRYVYVRQHGSQEKEGDEGEAQAGGRTPTAPKLEELLHLDWQAVFNKLENKLQQGQHTSFIYSLLFELFFPGWDLCSLDMVWFPPQPGIYI